jgi:hypothetical protein
LRGPLEPAERQGSGRISRLNLGAPTGVRFHDSESADQPCDAEHSRATKFLARYKQQPECAL